MADQGSKGDKCNSQVLSDTRKVLFEENVDMTTLVRSLVEMMGRMEDSVLFASDAAGLNPNNRNTIEGFYFHYRTTLKTTRL